jgi:hypothetical protein
VELDPRPLARTHGRQLVAQVRADCGHLAPDLLRRHVPRMAADGLLPAVGLRRMASRSSPTGRARYRPPARADLQAEFEEPAADHTHVVQEALQQRADMFGRRPGIPAKQSPKSAQAGHPAALSTTGVKVLRARTSPPPGQRTDHARTVDQVGDVSPHPHPVRRARAPATARALLPLCGPSAIRRPTAAVRR